MATDRLATVRHGFQRQLLGFWITIERLILQFAAHLVEQAIVTGAAELAEQGLVPGHSAFHHEGTVPRSFGFPYTKGPRQRGRP